MALSDEMLLPELDPDEWIALLEKVYADLRYQMDTGAHIRCSGMRPSVKMRAAK